MADFNSFEITNLGIALETRAQVEGNLNFTKFIIGDGTYSGSVKTLTGLIHPIMEVPISRLDSQTTGNSKFTIGFDLSSQDVTTGFYLREIGIYAQDPDGGSDILVFYGNAGDTADYIEPSSSATMTEKMIDIEMYIDDIATITATIDSSLVYATQDDLANLQIQLNDKAPTSHKSTTNIYGLGNDTYYGHTKVFNSLDRSTYAEGEALSAYQGYLLDQKFATYLPLAGGTLTGNIFAVNNKINFSTTGNIEWKENGYGDKFRIIPNFGGTDDANLLNIQGTVGGAGTDPTDWKTLLQITAKSGNILTPGYISATGGFRGNLTGNVTGNLTGNVTGNCSGSSGSCSGNATSATKLQTARTINGTNFNGTGNITTAKWGTARTLSLSGAVSGSANVDGSGNVTISTNITSGTAAPSSSTAGTVYIQYFT